VQWSALHIKKGRKENQGRKNKNTQGKRAIYIGEYMASEWEINSAQKMLGQWGKQRMMRPESMPGPDVRSEDSQPVEEEKTGGS
jgi:hypothetical protein